MKLHYDKEHDILYLAFKDGPSHEIIKSARNVMLGSNLGLGETLSSKT